MGEPRPSIADHALLHILAYFGMRDGSLAERYDDELRLMLERALALTAGSTWPMTELLRPFAQELLSMERTDPSFWRLRAQIEHEITFHHLRRGIDAMAALEKGAANA